MPVTYALTLNLTVMESISDSAELIRARFYGIDLPANVRDQGDSRIIQEYTSISGESVVAHPVGV